jgi:hypothetical protein
MAPRRKLTFDNTIWLLAGNWHGHKVMNFWQQDNENNPSPLHSLSPMTPLTAYLSILNPTSTVYRWRTDCQMNCSEIRAVFCSQGKWDIYNSSHKNTAFHEVVKFRKMWAVYKWYCIQPGCRVWTANSTARDNTTHWRCRPLIWLKLQ